MIDFLIKAGASIEARNFKGETPFFLARNPAFWKGIGANINARNNEGRTILMMCCAQREAPEPVDTSEMHPETAARHHMMQRMCQQRIENVASKIKILLELGADVSKRDKQGLTARDLAIQSGQPTLISLLD